MSRVTFLYGEQALLNEYNHRVAEKLNEKSPETKRKSTSSVGFTRGIRQTMEDIVTYDPFNSYLESPDGSLFDTKKDFYRLISLLLTDLGLVFDIRSPSPWRVISELQNRDIIGESDSANLKVCLSIANEVRLETYFANGGQKERFCPLPQSPDTPEQSTNDPIFRNLDEDTLVCLLITGYDVHRRCQEFCLKYFQQDEMDASILRNPSVSFPMALIKERLYSRLQNYDKASECLKSISKNSPEYDLRLNAQAHYHKYNAEWEKAIECYEIALEYSKDQIGHILLHRDLANVLIQRLQFDKARYNLEKAMKVHDEMFGEGSETILLRDLMLELGTLFHCLGDMQSAIQTFQRVDQMQKRTTRCTDIDMIHLNIHMALSYSRLGQDVRSLDYLERALCFSHKAFGEHTLISELLKIYQHAGVVYTNCARYDEALSMLEQSLKLAQSLYGDTAHPSKIGPKKIPVVPVSYREKTRVDWSEKTFLNKFFHGFSGFVSTRFNNYCHNTRHFVTLYDEPAATRRK